MARNILYAMAAMAALTSAALSQPQPAGVTYRSIEVSRFTVEGDAALPPDFAVAIMNDLAEQLRETKKFEMVFLERAGEITPPQPALKLAGVVKEFKPGSRTKRYLLGPWTGKTKIKAHVRFTDRESGQLLHEDDVDGKVIIGLLGGDSMGATRGLAKEVAKIAKKQFFTNE